MSDSYTKALQDVDLRMSVTHDLKVDPYYFGLVATKKKPFEVRNNDRNFKVGDYILLREFDRSTKKYTGQQLAKIRITYVLEDYPALVEGYVVLGLDLSGMAYSREPDRSDLPVRVDQV
ncbi:hypothetical protein 2AV2_79 [Nodularia phage vB_NpeS-2AV2]|uniref:DUF3850 domain-containing protein n=3 Tax=Ravarandavirus TaxID=2843444 RepID=A0A482MLQ2_9CAUD|nr:RNA-binding protein [Nodularia phage vB_NpeS-2AV2]YP_009844903.1 RNA-binding protein [Nodularia phage vB_NspS-kac68v161]ALY07531.1 hypothetical protein 2AV2_79 [Nodularia phage vB_NpeS-2AV2]QBQ73744.1 DUF3850 domain-containing protein [Nodularia phage vB_NspS-kac68v161]QBQ73940.1 DUF3850 domain-containing protein [Nodularia phage vB_NspS-kac68v162]